MASRRSKSTSRRQPLHLRETRPSRPTLIALAVLIVITGSWAYSTSFAGVFVLDDVRAIAQNPTIRTLSPLSVPLSPPPASTVSGRPVANLTFAVNYALAPADARDDFTPHGASATSSSGDRVLRNVWGYHFANLAIHLGAALLLFGLVRRTLKTEPLRPTFGSASPYLATIVACLWVVHPLQTESVSYVVQRVESLMGLFYLLTLYCAIRAAEGGARSRWWSAGAIGSCALGMATKEVMVTAPVVVALWDRVFRNRAGQRPRRAFIAALAASWLVFAALVAHEGRAPSLDLHAATAWTYLLTQTAIILHYIRLAFVPSPLIFLYGWPLAPSFAAVAGPAVIVAGLIVLTALAVVRRDPVGFAGAWFFLILAPTSSIVPIVTEVAAEHRMYLPLAAIIALIVCGGYVFASALVTALPARPAVRSTAAAAGVVLAAALVGALGVQTRGRNQVYWSETTLWQDTVAKQPANGRARVAYGSALAAEGRFADAEAQLKAAVDLNGADPIARTRLGTVLAAQDKVDAAVAELERALALSPDDVDAHRALGRLYASRQQDARAVVHLQRAIDVITDDPSLLTTLAAILADSPDPMVRDPTRALPMAERAVQLTGHRDPFALDVLSVVQANVGRLADAASTAREALALARAQGNEPLARELEYRVAAYAR